MGGRRVKILKVLGNYWRVDYFPPNAPAFCDYHRTWITHLFMLTSISGWESNARDRAY